MEKQFILSESSSRESMYSELLPQIESYISSDDEFISTLANVSSILKECMGFFWVGFYLKKNSESLYLGPFQGPPACTTIRYGRGVCGKAWKDMKTVIVPDVNLFPDHIACSSLSRSEIVVPLIDFSHPDDLLGVLDIDSVNLSDFDEIDKKYLERVANSICKTIK